MSTKIWVVRTEDIDEYDVSILAAFPTLESAIEYVKSLILRNVENDEDSYEEWLDDNQRPDNDNSKKMYTDEEMEEVHDEIIEMIIRIRGLRSDQNVQGSFVWSIHHYIFTETDLFL